MSQSPSNVSRVSRRTLAKGAAWSVPLVIGASQVAHAASSLPPKITGTICQLFYGGGTINQQTHSIYLGVTTSTGVIPKGTKLSWTICVTGGGSGTGGTNEYPSTNYSAGSLWTLTLTPGVTGGVLPADGCFTATMEFTSDYSPGVGPGGTWCAAALIWTDIYTIRPGASVAVTSNAPTGTGIVPGPSGTLNYTVARRHPTAVNTAGRTPHYYLSKSGGQACYPEIQYSRLLSSNGADNVTCYPAGTTVPAPICTWGGTTCGGTTGQCTPKFSTTPSTGQYLTPAVC